MARTGTGKRIAEGIYRFPTFLRVTAKAAGRQKEKRFPLGTEPREMQRWQLKAKTDLLSGPGSKVQGSRPRRPSSTDTLAASVPHFLATVPKGDKHDNYRMLLTWWAEGPLGELPRDQITRADILTQLARAESAGAAVSTRNHRLRAIRMLYAVLDADDEDARNPAASIKKTREPEPEARAVPYWLIEAILDALPEHRFSRKLTPSAAAALAKATQEPGASWSALARSYGVSEAMVRKVAKQPKRTRAARETAAKTRARYAVMAYTGLPPAQIMRLTPDDVDLEAKSVLVKPRRKGKGVKARTLPLLEEAVEAFRAFAEANAWGTWSTPSAQRSWNIAKAKVVKQLRAGTPKLEPQARATAIRLLEGMRPYDLRHSFGTQALRASKDLKAVKELLMHGDIRTTERYVGGAVDDVAAGAIAALQASLK
jgi:integrase